MLSKHPPRPLKDLRGLFRTVGRPGGEGDRVHRVKRAVGDLPVADL